MDSTVIEADRHPLTDPGRIADGLRRVPHVARKWDASLEEAPVPMRVRACAINLGMLAIGQGLRRRMGEAVAEKRRLTEALARIGETPGRAIARWVDRAKQQIAVLDQSRARRVAQGDHALQDLRTVIRQSRAATDGERMADRLVSLADPDARPIKKGELGQLVGWGTRIPGYNNDTREEKGDNGMKLFRNPVRAMDPDYFDRITRNPFYQGADHILSLPLPATPVLGPL